MIKTQPKTTHSDRNWFYYYDTGSGRRELTGKVTYVDGANTISYDDGARLPSGHWPWKSCTHTCDGRWSGIEYSSSTLDKKGSYYKGYDVIGLRSSPMITPAPRPNSPWDESTVEALLSQIDLNTGESVLLYSGIIQAIPLVGGVLKLSSILKKAAKKLSKEFRQKPFTTVVKTLISLDFIDRFVISPTIDDARRLVDATNYVLRVLATAQERNASRFALQSSSSVTHARQTRTETVQGPTGVGTISRTGTMRSETVSKAFMLLEAKYDIGALDPIKLWARRVGLTTPLDSMWDLVPFSFVIDYFTRAGDFIGYLSDKMSSVEGLRGVITKVHDMWGSVDNRVIARSTAELVSRPNPSRGWTRVVNIFRPDYCTYRNSRYTRFRISDPWSYLLRFERQLTEFLDININLSQTRKRTIAELIIQAKL